MQPSEFCLIYVERGLIFLIKSYLILQIATFTTFSVSELLRVNQEIPSPPARLALKLELFFLTTYNRGVLFSYNLVFSARK